MKVLNHPLEAILSQSIATAKNAGEAILEVYNGDDFQVEHKEDDSPLTKADLAAHRIIVDELSAAFPDIPCLSEESTESTFESRKQWPICFVIDPLDGTKEFIARNDEFTVNIALVSEGQSLMGVIYAPVLKTIYYAAQGMGAFRQYLGQPAEKIRVRSIKTKQGSPHLTIVASRRHGIKKVKTLCSHLQNYDLTSRGSSLKMCLIAEGTADLYPRLAPTCEWDTAAAQAIVEEAGGQLVGLDYSPLTYNQRDTLLNPFFLVLGDPDFDWRNSLVVPDA